MDPVALIRNTELLAPTRSTTLDDLIVYGQEIVGSGKVSHAWVSAQTVTRIRSGRSFPASLAVLRQIAEFLEALPQHQVHDTPLWVFARRAYPARRPRWWPWAPPGPRPGPRSDPGPGPWTLPSAGETVQIGLFGCRRLTRTGLPFACALQDRGVANRLV